MPHSVSPEASPVEDSILPDAPPQALVEEADTGPASHDTGFGDMNGYAGEKASSEVKLEDLFLSDDEDDEEFPMFSAPSAHGKVEHGSPPAAPLYSIALHCPT